LQAHSERLALSHYEVRIRREVLLGTVGGGGGTGVAMGQGAW
jgi:hypothetical protein